MKLRHATPRVNLSSIRERGLLLSFARCTPAAVWLHVPSRSAGLTLHAMRRHACDDIAVIEVNVPRSWLTRSRWRGLWIVRRDVPPSRIRSIVETCEESP